MQITVSFDSIEEMQGFARQIAGEEEGRDRAGKPEKKTVKAQKPDLQAGPEPTQGQTDPQDTEAETSTENTETVQEETAYTLEEVRAKLAELQKSGKRAEVKALLTSFGAVKLSEIPASRYTALMVKAGEL